MGVWCIVYGGLLLIRPSQPSFAGVGAGAELGKKKKQAGAGAVPSSV